MDLILTSPLWVLARAAGAVLLVVLTVVLSLGVATSAGLRRAGVPRFAVQLLHRDAALVALVLLALHVATVVVDGYVDIGVVDLLVPFTAGYAPLFVGLGTLALDLLIAVAVTSLLRVRIGLRAWRGVHLLAYACWPLALVHGIGAGTDGTSAWMLAVDAACVALLVAALGLRARARAARRAEADISAPRRPLTPAGAPR